MMKVTIIDRYYTCSNKAIKYCEIYTASTQEEQKLFDAVGFYLLKTL